MVRFFSRLLWDNIDLLLLLDVDVKVKFLFDALKEHIKL